MSAYTYVAIDPRGKEKKGNIEADSKERAMEALRADGLVPLSVDDQNLLSRDLEFNIGGKPKPRDLSVFCRQFYSIIDAGVAIVDALGMLIEQTENKRLRQAIADAKFAIETGDSLADGLRPHEDIFSHIFISMIEAGEASGSLDVSLSRMADQYEKDARLKAMVKKATVYPSVVGVLAVLVIIAMLAFVIPTFESMFADMGTELPAITQAVIAASEFMQKFWWLVIGGIVGVVAFLKYYAKTVPGQYLFGRLEMKLPLFGNLALKSASSAMSRTLSTLMAAGIPLITALEITAGTMDNIYFKDAIMDTRNEVAMGSSISEPLTRSGVFPPLVCHMLKIGEETGNIEAMLDKLADYYDDEVQVATEALMAALEPAIIVVLAVIIGVIVISIISPMASMYEGLDTL